MAYFNVTCRCGHVGKGRYVPISFPVIANSRKEASKIGRDIPRVKHHNKKAIISCTEISYQAYLELRKLNAKDEYLRCKNIQQQRAIENFESRIVYDPQIKNTKRKSLEERDQIINYKRKKNHEAIKSAMEMMSYNYASNIYE